LCPSHPVDCGYQQLALDSYSASLEVSKLPEGLLGKAQVAHEVHSHSHRTMHLSEICTCAQEQSVLTQTCCASHNRALVLQCCVRAKDIHSARLLLVMFLQKHPSHGHAWKMLGIVLEISNMCVLDLFVLCSVRSHELYLGIGMMRRSTHMRWRSPVELLWARKVNKCIFVIRCFIVALCHLL
jgi:hypothetical protein